MQLNLAGLVLAALTIGNRRVQVANFISFKAGSFGPESATGRTLTKDCNRPIAAVHREFS